MGRLVGVRGDTDDLDPGVGAECRADAVTIDPQVRDDDRSDESHTHILLPGPTVNP